MHVRCPLSRQPTICLHTRARGRGEYVEPMGFGINYSQLVRDIKPQLLCVGEMHCGTLPMCIMVSSLRPSIFSQYVEENSKEESPQDDILISSFINHGYDVYLRSGRG